MLLYSKTTSSSRNAEMTQVCNHMLLRKGSLDAPPAPIVLLCLMCCLGLLRVLQNVVTPTAKDPERMYNMVHAFQVL